MTPEIPDRPADPADPAAITTATATSTPGSPTDPTTPADPATPADPTDGAAPVAGRRAVAGGALALQAIVLVAWAVDLPFALRLPLGLAYAFAVPGFAVVGLLRLADPATEAALSVTASIALGIAVAQVLVWADLYRAGTALGVLAAVSVAGLLVQLGAAKRRPRRGATS